MISKWGSILSFPQSSLLLSANKVHFNYSPPGLGVEYCGGREAYYVQQVHEVCSQRIAYIVRRNFKGNARALLNKAVKVTFAESKRMLPFGKTNGLLKGIR